MISRDLAKGCQAYCTWCSIPVRKTTGRAPLESNQIRSGAMASPWSFGSLPWFWSSARRSNSLVIRAPETPPSLTQGGVLVLAEW